MDLFVVGDLNESFFPGHDPDFLIHIKTKYLFPVHLPKFLHSKGSFNCLEKCSPQKVPYCITKALIDAVRGDVENGLVFCGANTGRIHEITTVHHLMQELAGDLQ